MRRQDAEEKKRLVEIKNDGELLISQFLSQETLEEDTKALLAHVAEDQSSYTAKLAELDEEEKKLQKEINKLSGQRELLAREASRATAESRGLKELLKVKNLLLVDHDKQTLETFFRLEQCSAKYEVRTPPFHVIGYSLSPIHSFVTFLSAIYRK
jgi:cell division protein FtsB